VCLVTDVCKLRLNRSLGLLLKKRGQYLEARHLYDRAIRILENRFGRSHYKYALVLSNIADVDRKVRE